jgi:hypothetical protein
VLVNKQAFVVECSNLRRTNKGNRERENGLWLYGTRDEEAERDLVAVGFGVGCHWQQRLYLEEEQG